MPASQKAGSAPCRGATPLTAPGETTASRGEGGAAPAPCQAGAIKARGQMVCPPTCHAARQHRGAATGQRRRLVASLSAPGITPERLPVPATSGGVTLAAWLERAILLPYLWWRRQQTQAFVPGLREQGKWIRGVPAQLERGPVALWWYYRGKQGDLWVAFFLFSR